MTKCCTCNKKILDQEYCVWCNKDICESCWNKDASCKEAKIDRFKKSILKTENEKMINFYKWIWN